ncbi:hypothetical protein QN239_31130 [Mycolicibacterium sp. Y3]
MTLQTFFAGLTIVSGLVVLGISFATRHSVRKLGAYWRVSLVCSSIGAACAAVGAVIGVIAGTVLLPIANVVWLAVFADGIHDVLKARRS